MKTIALVLALSMATGPAWAQSASASGVPGGPEIEAPSPAAVPEGTADLPVSLDRIKRELAISYARPADPLRLHYYVEVYGKMQRLDLLKGEDLSSAAVPYGGPTHKDILYQITPEEFRSPPADIGALVALLAQWLSGKKTAGK
jgi:hypothetical protein